MKITEINELTILKDELLRNGSDMSGYGFKLEDGAYVHDGFGIYNSICSQFDNYILYVGIGLVVGYIILSWVLYWFFNYGYKKLTYKKDNEKFHTDLTIERNRVYWYLFILDKMIKLFMGYTIIVVYILFKR